MTLAEKFGIALERKLKGEKKFTREVMILSIGKSGDVLESRVNIIQSKQIELRNLLQNQDINVKSEQKL